MLPHSFRPPLWFLSLAAVLAFGGAARSDFIISVEADVRPTTNGLYLYNYTLTDPADSLFTVAAFSPDLSINANLSAILGPPGWTSVYQAGGSFMAIYSPEPSSDILPGTSGVVSFLSPMAPRSGNYLGVGFNSNGCFDFAQGTTLVPGGSPLTTLPEPAGSPLTNLPEPAGIVHLLTGLCTACLARLGYIARRKNNEKGE
jgi:hypothetical protein